MHKEATESEEVKTIAWLAVCVIVLSAFAVQAGRTNETRSTDLAWDCVYDVEWHFPESDACVWVRAGSATRTIDNGDLLTLVSGSNENYARTDIATSVEDGFLAEVRWRQNERVSDAFLRVTNAVGCGAGLRLTNDSGTSRLLYQVRQAPGCTSWTNVSSSTIALDMFYTVRIRLEPSTSVAEIPLLFELNGFLVAQGTLGVSPDYVDRVVWGVENNALTEVAWLEPITEEVDGSFEIGGTGNGLEYDYVDDDPTNDGNTSYLSGIGAGDYEMEDLPATDITIDSNFFFTWAKMNVTGTVDDSYVLDFRLFGVGTCHAILGLSLTLAFANYSGDANQGCDAGVDPLDVSDINSAWFELIHGVGGTGGPLVTTMVGSVVQYRQNVDASWDYVAYKLAVDLPPDDVPDPTPLPHPVQTRGPASDVDILSTDPSYVMWYDLFDSDTALPAALQQLYVIGEADYEVMHDVLVVPKSDAERIWINDTKSTTTTADDTIMLNTTDQFSSIDLAHNPIISHSGTNVGENVTVTKPEGTAYDTERYSTVRVTRSFEWTIATRSASTWTHAFGLDNDLTRDLLNVELYIPFEPTVLADLKTVELFDVSNNQILLPGNHYILSSTGVWFGFDTLSSGSSRTFTVTFTELVEGTDILEPTCTLLTAPSPATFEGVSMLSVSVSCINQNAFVYTGRVVINLGTLGTEINVHTLRVTDTAGSKFTNIVPITSMIIAIYGVTMSAFTSRELILYFTFVDANPSRNWLRENLWTVFMLGIVLIFAGITLAIWPHKRDDKQRKMTGILVIVIGGLIASISLAAGLALG